MLSPESKLSVAYLEGLKDCCGRVMNFDYILRLKPRADLGGFVEAIKFVWPEIYVGLHVTDPNWYDEGDYVTGAVEPELLETFDKIFRISPSHWLKEDQVLEGICYYSRNKERADLMICVAGGEYDDCGQFMKVILVEGSDPFKLDYNPSLVTSLKEKAAIVGKQEISFHEYYRKGHNLDSEQN